MLAFVHTDTTERLRDREAFVAVALAAICGLYRKLPFPLGGVFHGPFTDLSGEILRSYQLVEAMSGFTTTGSTVIDQEISKVLLVSPVIG